MLLRNNIILPIILQYIYIEFKTFVKTIKIIPDNFFIFVDAPTNHTQYESHSGQGISQRYGRNASPTGKVRRTGFADLGRNSTQSDVFIMHFAVFA